MCNSSERFVLAIKISGDSFRIWRADHTHTLISITEIQYRNDRGSNEKRAGCRVCFYEFSTLYRNISITVTTKGLLFVLYKKMSHEMALNYRV